MQHLTFLIIENEISKVSEKGPVSEGHYF